MAMNPRLLVPRASYDPDAARYLAAVEAADGQALETPVKRAVDAFIKGCKADGIWDAIKASCLLCGPRTLSGALVPLVGTAPTSYAFASGDYNRVTGLKGDGSTTYLDSGRAGDADGQNDNHQSVYISSVDTRYATTVGVRYIGASNAASTSRTTLGTYDNDVYANNMAASQVISGASAAATGLLGSSRSLPSEYSVRSGGSNFSVEGVDSVLPPSHSHAVFGDAYPTAVSGKTDARLAFYSIGAALSLESLDTRISAYVAAIAAAL